MGVTKCGSILAAALAIPTLSLAQGSDQAIGHLGALDVGSQISIRWLSYRDWQPGFDRIRVHAPYAALQLAVTDAWSLDASGTIDSVSGASPRYHSAVSGASAMVDRRRAGTVGFRYRQDQWQWSTGLVRSNENDFESKALVTQLAWETDDRNRRLSVGLGRRLDRIGSVNDPSLNERRETSELSLAVSQVMTARDVVQMAYWRSSGEGYFTDPYKLPDERPAARLQQSLQWRWNHYQTALRMPLRFGYRYYHDSYGVRAHTLWFDPHIVLTNRLSFIPSIRLYSQSSASFYYNPRFAYRGIPIPESYTPGTGQWISADQRLAAFGAATLGVQWIYQFSERYIGDIGIYRYEQRTAWHWVTPGSRGLEPLRALNVQLGLSYKF